MALKVCPRCTSWRVQGSETGSFRDRLLLSLQLRLYSCDDCDWYGIGRIKRKNNHLGDNRRFLAKKEILAVLVLFAACAFAVSALLVHLVGSSDQKAEFLSWGRSKTAPAITTSVSPSVAPAADPLPSVKVIGNRDSKRYHLPGMVYYDRVKAYHRIEFSSEQEAIAAGYRKAPR